MTNLTIDTLLALSADAVPGQVRESFTASLQRAPSVHGTFFSSAGPAPQDPPADIGWLDGVASALVCSAIARSSLYEFSRTVYRERADAYWQGELAGANGLAVSQRLYGRLFPMWCRDGHGTSFYDFLNLHLRRRSDIRPVVTERRTSRRSVSASSTVRLGHALGNQSSPSPSHLGDQPGNDDSY